MLKGTGANKDLDRRVSCVDELEAPHGRVISAGGVARHSRTPTPFPSARCSAITVCRLRNRQLPSLGYYSHSIDRLQSHRRRFTLKAVLFPLHCLVSESGTRCILSLTIQEQCLELGTKQLSAS